jgi:hypothetical protein
MAALRHDMTNFCFRALGGEAMFRSLTLMLLRISTGALLMIWGVVRFIQTDRAIGLSERFYFGLVSTPLMQHVLGGLQIFIGAMVILGVFRRVFYPLQAVALGLGGLAVWRSYIDPLGQFFGREGTNLLFFPSSTVFFATLVLIAFIDHDHWSIDKQTRRRRSGNA